MVIADSETVSLYAPLTVKVFLQKNRLGLHPFSQFKSGEKHCIIADSELKIIEVQFGKEISVNDKQKFPFPEEVGSIE